jgi:hypothetical protein
MFSLHLLPPDPPCTATLCIGFFFTAASILQASRLTWYPSPRNDFTAMLISDGRSGTFYRILGSDAMAWIPFNEKPAHLPTCPRLCHDSLLGHKVYYLLQNDVGPFCSFELVCSHLSHLWSSDLLVIMKGTIINFICAVLASPFPFLEILVDFIMELMLHLSLVRQPYGNFF